MLDKRTIFRGVAGDARATDGEIQALPARPLAVPKLFGGTDPGMPLLLNLIYLVLLLLTFPYWVYASLRSGKYRQGLWQRLSGSVPKAAGAGGVIWIHAVSVGEVLLIRPLVARFRRDRPDLSIVLTVTTNTGYAVAREQFKELPIYYSPLDFSWAVRRVFTALEPQLLVLVELELWPNLLLEARRRHVPVAVVNARMSERSFRGYMRIQAFLRPVLHAVRWWGAQTDVYAYRITELTGTHGARVAVTGSMKYEGAPTDRNHPRTRSLRQLLGFQPGEKVLVAGSTQAPEEEVVLAAFAKLAATEPRLRLILVPRHRERFEEVAELLGRSGLPFVRRSQLSAPLPVSAAITLIDTIGELGSIWGLADYAFVGGSLDGRRGGQSMIEPAGYGVPVCFGPHTWNFQETVDKLLILRAAVQLQSSADLLSTLRGWLAHPERAEELGRAARAFILSQQGAVEATFQALGRLVPAGVGAVRQSA